MGGRGSSSGRSAATGTGSGQVQQESVKTAEVAEKAPVQQESEQEFSQRMDKKYIADNPHAWTAQQEYDMKRSKTTYAAVDLNRVQGNRIVVQNAYAQKDELKAKGFRYDGSGGWYKSLGTPEENRETVSYLRSKGIPVKMSNETRMRAQYDSGTVRPVYEKYGPTEGGRKIDEAAGKSVERFGL